MTDDLDWEKAFLWQKVSQPHCEARWVRHFPCPALDIPLEDFPQEILKWGLTIRLSESTDREWLEFAAAVLNAVARDPLEPATAADVPWRDVKSMARGIIAQLERENNLEAIAMGDRVREHQMARDDYKSFFRFRDSDRKPLGMGFRGTRDVFLLDDEYLTDFLNRAGQRGPSGLRKRSDVKLISFLNSVDAAKVTTLAVSPRPFREKRTRLYLCYAVVRTFPNLKKLLLTSIGTVDSDPTHPWSVKTQEVRLGTIQDLAEHEVRENEGISFMDRPDEDPGALFDIANMSPELIEATGAHVDGKGRALAGKPARTPMVAYGVAAGLLHDPAVARAGDVDDEVKDNPPFVDSVQYALTGAFRVITRRKEAAALATRAETLSKLMNRPTKLPRPVRSPRESARPVARLYRRTEVTPEGFVEWVWGHAGRLVHRAEGPLEEASETDPGSEASLPAEEVGPVDREYARVEPLLLVYDRDSFDGNVQSGWTGFGPGVDMSHFRTI